MAFWEMQDLVFLESKLGIKSQDIRIFLNLSPVNSVTYKSCICFEYILDFQTNM